jgi:hypothetical protein
MAETSKTVAFRVSLEINEKIREAAAAAKGIPSEWVRGLVLKALHESVDPATSDDGGVSTLDGSLVADLHLNEAIKLLERVKKAVE